MRSGLQVLSLEELKEKAFTKFAIRLKTFQLLYVSAGQTFSSVASPFLYFRHLSVGEFVGDEATCTSSVALMCLQCFDTVGWASVRASGL